MRDVEIESLVQLVHSQSDDGLYIFHFLWDYWIHRGVFENGVLLMYMQRA